MFGKGRHSSVLGVCLLLVGKGRQLCMCLFFLQIASSLGGLQSLQLPCDGAASSTPPL